MATNAPVSGEATVASRDFRELKIKEAFGIDTEDPEALKTALYPFALQKLGGVTGFKRPNPS